MKAFFGCIGACLIVSLSAQQPDTLKVAIPAPAVGFQTDAALGTSVAVDGNFAVAGAPNDDTGSQDGGVIKVFHSTTGALLHTLTNPSPTDGDHFGAAVAISGSRVVVGAPFDDTGSPNAGSIYVYDLSSGNPTVPVATINNPSPAPNENFGCAVAISGTRIIAGAINDDTGAVDAGSAFVYDLASGTPTVPIQTLNNPEPGVGDHFGVSVAISGTRAVVGAANDDTGATDTGSAYAYDFGTGTPAAPIATLNNPSPAASDSFGVSVAISGTRVVVGADRDDTGGNDSGIAYVYDLASGTPTVPVQTLNNPAPGVSDHFGTSVAISGTRAVIGAQGDDTAGTDSGSAYVYELTGVTPLIPATILNNSSPAVNDNFGGSVAVNGTRVLIGASGDDAAATNAGTAYGYDMAGGSPANPVTTLSHTGPAANDNFGFKVAISGVFMVVGSPGDDSAADDAGAAYVYDLASTTPTLPAYILQSPAPAAGDQFGVAVAIFGTRVVIGASLNDTGASNAGSAYVFDLDSSTPAVPAYILNNPSPAVNDFFGGSVAISGTRVIVGASNDDTGATDAGSAYAYELASATPQTPMAILNNPTPATGDSYGFSVSVSGSRAVVGAYNDDTGATDAGSVYVYELGGATPGVPAITLNNPAPTSSDRFGIAVSISGNRIVVGAYNDDAGALDAGSAYVYDVTGGSPTVPTHTLSNPSPSSSDNFGFAVAISGTRVVIGAGSDDAVAIDSGSAYVYDLASGSPTIPVATLNNPGAASGDSFGTAVAIDKSSVVIGAPLDDSQVSDKGTVYFFRPANNDTDGDGLLDLWEEARFGSLPGQNALGDQDHDGRTELMEQAFNSNPFRPDPVTGPLVTLDGGFLTLTVTKRAGVTYFGESSGSPDAPSFSPSTTTILVNSATTLKVRDNFPVSGGGKRFLRFKLTSSP